MARAVRDCGYEVPQKVCSGFPKEMFCWESTLPVVAFAARL
jgi:hypothetical protein